MKTNTIRWKIGGPAGFGIKVTGELVSQTILRHGWHVFDYTEYPSLIRGGHNTYHVHGSETPIHASAERVDVLVALDKNTVDWHSHLVNDNGGIIYNSETIKLDEATQRKSVRWYPMPLAQLAKSVGGDEIMRNTVATGASLALMHADMKIYEQLIRDKFERKGAAIVEKNLKAADAGFQYIRQNFPNDFAFRVTPTAGAPSRMAMPGNDAIALGAIKAGVKLYCAYPMTPSSTVLHFLAEKAKQFNIVVKHAEDEISVINMAIGGAYAGVRSMIGTSGGGFSLMVEALGLAGITETPLVALLAMRPGPATGLPTWTGQGDLRFAMHAAQGEFPRVMVAPGDLQECFTETYRAFNLAEKYQTPVIIFTDKYLAESRLTIDELDQTSLPPIDRGEVATAQELKGQTRFKRYAVTKSGISPRSLPGTAGGVHLANSDEHDEEGFSEESSNNAVAMMDKRYRKMTGIENDIPAPQLYGPPTAEITFIGWGSTKGVMLDAIQLLAEEGIAANYLHVLYILPFPSGPIAATMANAKRTMVVEGNKTGQLTGLIRQYTGRAPDLTYFKYDGRPFWPEEIVRRVHDVLGKHS